MYSVSSVIRVQISEVLAIGCSLWAIKKLSRYVYLHLMILSQSTVSGLTTLIAFEHRPTRNAHEFVSENVGHIIEH